MKQWKNIIEDTFDVFLISETKIDNSFPNSQFSINEYRMFQHDRNCFGGGLCLYVKDSIVSKQLNSHKENRYSSNIFRNKYTKNNMAVPQAHANLLAKKILYF